MPAPRKYPDELRERAIRLMLDVEEETGKATAACRRVGEELGINQRHTARLGEAGPDRLWQAARDRLTRSRR